MTIFLKTWLMGITAAAILIALAEALTPSGTVKKVGRLVGGLILMLTVIRPILTMQPADLSDYAAAWRNEIESTSQDLEKENNRLMKIIIEEQTGAYIVKQAEALGISCEAVVVCAQSESGLFVPIEVEIIGNLTAEDRQSLAQMLALDLGVPADCQDYRGVNGE